MTIDEAIVRERRLTAGYRNDIQILKNFGADILSITSVTKQMEYHEQLANWLEELKEYKEHEFDILKKDGELLYKHGILDGYNKAIDDFAKMAKELKHEDGELSDIDLDYIAGFLKKGE